MRIAIISSGYFPVPATLGGAVETLIERAIDSNEADKSFDLTVFSTYNADAERKASKFKNTQVEYIRDNQLIEKLDLLVYSLAKKVIKNDRTMSFRYILHRIAYIFTVSKLLSEKEYDYVVVENTATLFWCLRLRGNYKKYENKYIYHLHNEIGSTFGCKKLLLNSSQVWGVSEYVNRTVREFLPETNNCIKFRVLHNVIDVNSIADKTKNREYLREKYGFREDDIVCIFVGRLCKDKGIEELLEAFAEISDERIKLLIVGNYYFGTNLESDFEKHLKTLIDVKRNDVVFTGFVHNSEIGAYYNCADIAVLPSIWDEPAGLTVIEAMAASLSVITTNSGGIPEYVDGNAIILDKTRSNLVSQIKEAITLLASNKEQRKEYGNNAYQRALLFDSSKYASTINTFLTGEKSDE